eukprot:CAMPEP_0114403066 /NCGR_PEP_ID=MMETSP0102-20121206/18532_1 /TAXON_ID=38822 ORGANISM="Pteridomonas danica, Strain PT" /NCGR_SAMPLE_ID=MMETSP0102 /ASSEMBLY_ACC=CAM_ASM_000212 /LENGTH=49 /DNA_ID= /DNA_START= /DNA_END= /DNA_ORIENTATION=
MAAVVVVVQKREEEVGEIMVVVSWRWVDELIWEGDEPKRRWKKKKKKMM